LLIECVCACACVRVRHVSGVKCYILKVSIKSQDYDIKNMKGVFCRKEAGCQFTFMHG